MSASAPQTWPAGIELGPCSNVLPGTTFDALEEHARSSLPALREGWLGTDGPPMGVGLWLAAPVARALDADPAAADRLRQRLNENHVRPFTLNGFPFGDFHGARVKDDVFRPAWDRAERRDHTLALGRILARWRDEGELGSISTLTGGFKAWGERPDFRARCAANLLAVAVAFDRLWQETGREIVLALEPEPASTLETTDEVIEFFEHHLMDAAARAQMTVMGVDASRAEEIVRRHLGICYDACHQAVEFEDPIASIESLRAAGLRIAKFQVTSALDVAGPGRAEVQAQLRRFAEPRYLHQVARRDDDGSVHVHPDLETLLPAPPAAWRRAERWRIHYHVPVHHDQIAGLGTTREDLRRALRHVVEHRITTHLEVETYTWDVLDETSRSGESLIEGLARELQWTASELRAAGPAEADAP